MTPRAAVRLRRSAFGGVAVLAVVLGVRNASPPNPVFALASEGCTVIRSDSSAFYDGTANLGAALVDFERSSCAEPMENVVRRLRTRLKGWREVPTPSSRHQVRFARGPWPRSTQCDVIGVEPAPAGMSGSQIFVSPRLRRVSAPFGPLWVGLLRPEWLKRLGR